jgi:3-oxoacyl-[acyl-carrier protein] reductase
MSKTAIVTGASGGIGLAIVERLSKEGYVVYAQYNKNKEMIEELSSKNSAMKVYPVCFDLTNASSIDKCVNEIKKQTKKIDLLVNCAGIGLYKLAQDTTIDEWNNLFNVNVSGAHYLTAKVVDLMVSNKSGNIVNISSIWGSVGASMEVAYSASKSALIGYTKALAKEVAPSGIRVNCVCPGVIDTKMNSRFSKEEIQELIEQTPLGRLGSGEDVANAVCFLASDESSFITGQVVTVDGGFTL